MIAYLLIAAALTSLGYFLLGRVPVCDRSATTGETPPLSIIIPARNEQENLPRLLKSIHAQGVDRLEIIVVDDASTDDTAALAREGNATVLAAPPLAAGWRGKTWACLHGARAATHPTLLFLDADAWFEPGGLAAVIRHFSRQPTVLSVLPYHVVLKPYENASAFFQLAMAAGSAAFTFPGFQPAGLFGQMLLVDRNEYFAIGGHESVKSEILENFHLARLLRRAGVPLACAGGKGALSMRMYPGGMRGLIDGWTKAFAAGAARTPLLMLMLVVAWFAGLVMTAGAPLRYPGWYSSAVYLFAALQLFILLRRLGSFRFYVAVLYPIPLFVYFLLFARALTRRRVSWKGRTIDAFL